MQNNRDKGKWNINIEEEREFWKKNIIGLFIILPAICQYCQKGNIGIKNYDSVLNPLQGKCHNYHCTRNIWLRKGTIFEASSKIPLSVLYKILVFWITDKKNIRQIKIKLEEEYGIEKLNPKFIYAFITNCRKAIATHLKNVYKLDRLADNNEHNNIAVDESLFTHIANKQIWIVGLINIDKKQLRLEIVTDRTANTLKIIIMNHIGTGNSIFTDMWSGYNFLDEINSGYYHYTSNHSINQFGLTARIEGIWGSLKNDIKKIYTTIPSNNFVYFLREAEFRWCIKDLNNENKLKELANLLYTLKVGDKIEYLDEDELTDIDYETYYEY